MAALVSPSEVGIQPMKAAIPTPQNKTIATEVIHIIVEGALRGGLDRRVVIAVFLSVWGTGVAIDRSGIDAASRQGFGPSPLMHRTRLWGVPGGVGSLTHRGRHHERHDGWCEAVPPRLWPWTLCVTAHRPGLTACLVSAPVLEFAAPRFRPSPRGFSRR